MWIYLDINTRSFDLRLTVDTISVLNASLVIVGSSVPLSQRDPVVIFMTGPTGRRITAISGKFLWNESDILVARLRGSDEHDRLRDRLSRFIVLSVTDDEVGHPQSFGCFLGYRHWPSRDADFGLTSPEEYTLLC